MGGRKGGGVYRIFFRGGVGKMREREEGGGKGS